jgi:beta-N-acetylhexosaminidase
LKKRNRIVFLLLLALLLGGCGIESSSPGGAPKETGRAEETGGQEAGRMSVRDAVGQMFVVSMNGTEPDYYIEKMIRERNIGGVILFGPNMQSEEGTKRLISSLQELSMAAEPKVPLFVAVDHEGGAVQHAPWVKSQPSAAEVGSGGDPGEARRVSSQIGRELRRAGVNTNFAPVADTGSGAAIGDRSYGSDPALVGRMAAASVDGFEDAGVVSAAKHFPNHGPAVEDSHVGYPRVEHGMDEVRSFDLPPFRDAVGAGVPMVMVGHLVYPAIDPERPASLSPRAIRLLREELGFRGVVVTDDLAMEGARRGGTAARAAVEAVEAGADLLVLSGLPQEQADAYDAVVAAVESGEIPRGRIEESLRRIEQVKDRYPLAR